MQLPCRPEHKTPTKKRSLSINYHVARDVKRHWSEQVTQHQQGLMVTSGALTHMDGWVKMHFPDGRFGFDERL